MILTSAKKRADEFAAAIEGRGPTEELRPELAALTELVEALRAHPQPAPRQDFTASLRARLVAEAERTSDADRRLALPPRRRGTRERRLAVAASAFVLVGGSAGMAAASQSAVPGESLYPIKQAWERARTGLADSDAERGRVLLQRADSRLQELATLAAGSAAPPVLRDTLDDFVGQAQEGSASLLASYEQTRDEQAVATVRDFTAGAMTDLSALGAEVDSDLAPAVAEAALVVQQIDRAAAESCRGCSPRPALDLPGTLTPALDAARVLADLDGLALDNDHPLVTRRITISESRPGTADRDQDGGRDGSQSGGSGGDGSGAGGGPDPGIDLPGVDGSPEISVGGTPDPGEVVEDVTKKGQQVVDDVTSQTEKGTGVDLPDTDPQLDPLLP